MQGRLGRRLQVVIGCRDCYFSFFFFFFTESIVITLGNFYSSTTLLQLVVIFVANEWVYDPGVYRLRLGSVFGVTVFLRFSHAIEMALTRVPEKVGGGVTVSRRSGT
jgi:hypothetical protein